MVGNALAFFTTVYFGRKTNLVVGSAVACICSVAMSIEVSSGMSGSFVITLYLFAIIVSATINPIHTSHIAETNPDVALGFVHTV